MTKYQSINCGNHGEGGNRTRDYSIIEISIIYSLYHAQDGETTRPATCIQITHRARYDDGRLETVDLC